MICGLWFVGQLPDLVFISKSKEFGLCTLVVVKFVMACDELLSGGMAWLGANMNHKLSQATLSDTGFRSHLTPEMDITFFIISNIYMLNFFLLNYFFFFKQYFPSKVIIQRGLLDPVGAQHCYATEWLRSVLSIWVAVFTFNSGLNAAKSTHHTKKASNKSCSELNFLQKSPQEYMSISPQSGAWGLERLIWLRYDIVLKWKNTFNLGLNAAKSTHHRKKSFK